MIRKIIPIMSAALISVASVNAYAVAEGFYMGVMTGPASNDGSTVNVLTESGSPVTTPADPRSNQWGTRLFLGNKFNSYASFEMGGAFFSDINYDTKGVEPANSVNARVRTIDILGKLDYSFRNTIGVFAKGGIAITYLTLSGGLSTDNANPGKQSSEIRYRPTVTVGASYDLNQSWVADLSWNRIMVGDVVNSVDFFGIGISYHFVDQYCGQFLC